MARLLDWPSTIVYPSAGDLATASTPRLPPAPGLLSITKVQPVAAATFWLVSRATMSVPPPGGNGTTRRIGLAGQACANALAVRVLAASASSRRREACIVVSS